MMTNTGRRTRIITGATWIIALLFLLGVWLLSLTAIPSAVAEDDLPSIDYYAIPESEWLEITDSDVTSFFKLSNPTMAKPANGKIENASNFCYAMFSGATDSNFTLTKHVRITASNWYDKNPTLGSGTVLDGALKVIWNEAIVTVDDNNNVRATAKDVVGGLFAQSNGIIRNLYFYFTGAYYTKILEGSSSLTCGGFIAKNYGTIDHCHIEVDGSISTEAMKKETVSTVGGVIGENKGAITNSTIISAAELSVYNGASPSTEYKYCTLYAGGVIGLLSSEGFNGCSVLSKAKVMCCDSTRFFGNLTSAVAQFVKAKILGQDIPEEDFPFNPVRYVHPAGGIIACAKGASYAKNSSFEAWGNANSIGYEGSSDDGTIAGGFIGLLADDYAGAIDNNYFKLGCYVGVSYIQILEVDVAQIANELINNRSVNLYDGEWIGRSASGKPHTFNNNVLYIEGDNSIIEAGVNDDNEDATAKVGLVCGSSIRNSTDNKNNWLVRKLSQCDTGKITENSAQNAGFNFVNVFGDGIVVATPSSTGNITMKAAPGKSPFYGWSTEPNKDEPVFNTSKTRQFSGAQNQVQYLFFIDTKIKSSGELTQFALDVNLIKSYVWAHLSESGYYTDDEGNEKWDGKAHFSGMKITLKWLTAYLEEDILVESGTPVIEDFYGKFYGNGHKISFASGSRIMHDFKKDSDDDDKEYYEEYTTGLFGNVMSGAVVQDLKIVYGGNIKEEGGLVAHVTEDGKSQMNTLKETPEDGTNTVESRTSTYSAFSMPSSLDVDTAYLYLFTGDGYDSSREWNPGYMEILPCDYDVVVQTHYIGVLAGKNYGTISGIELEMTTTGSITAQAKNIVCGGLIGYNNGSVSNADVTVKGKIVCTSSASSKVGGMFGINAGNSSVDAYSNLNTWIAGEISLKRAEKYHRVAKHFYGSAKTFSTKEECEDNGYTVIAYDFKDDEKYVFGVKNSQAIVSDTIHGNDATSIEEIIGVLIGEASGSTQFRNCVASAGYEGAFNSEIIQYTEDDAKIGAVIGNATSVPAFYNVWAVMSSLSVGRKPISNRSVENGINTVYVDGGIAVGTIDEETDPIKFAIEAIEGKTFAGWYDHVTVEGNVLNTDDKQMIMTGFETAEVIFGEGEDALPQLVEYFRPSNQEASNRIYYVRLINLQISQPSDLVALSETTRAGRSYEDITFTLAENIAIPASFKPIGTEEHPFLGIFDGNGLKMTFSGVGDASAIGIFGCVGKEGSTLGTVKNVNVEVTGDLGTTDTAIIGVIAAKNYGTIGQDSSNGKIIVVVERTLRGVIAGGVVGENHGVVKNCEVTYLSTVREIGALSANGSQGTAYAGGAVGRNLDATAVVKNAIITFEDVNDTAQILVTGSSYMLGGIVGENGAGATVATSVVVAPHEMILGGVMGHDDTQYGGYLIGKNLSQNVRSLWVLYTDPSLGAPVKVYDENNEDDIILVNGDKSEEGNILIMYGEGIVDIAISGVNDKITFYADKAQDGADFYAYLSDFNIGTYVSVEEGNTGYAFSPVEMAGKVYYAVFANSMIGSEADYNALAARINNDDFRAYVNYSVTKSFEIRQTGSVAIGKDKDHPFRGSMNGNGYFIYMEGNEAEEYSIHAFIGYVGEYSTVSYVKVVAQSGSKLVETGNNVSRGVLTDVNNGTIQGVQVIVRGIVYNAKGAIGAVTGENNGTISSASIDLEYLEYLGIKSYGAFVGKYVGGAVGINKGIVGDLDIGTVEVYIESKEVYIDGRKDKKSGLLYGSEATGGIVGVNEATGDILSCTSMISGVLIGDGNVGGIVGVNKGTIREAFSNVLADSTYFAGENFGGIAGSNENNAAIGVNHKAFVADIRAYVAASPCYDTVTYTFTVPRAAEPFLTKTVENPVTKKIGGAIGVNKGELYSLSVEIAGPLYASLNVGGIAGLNQGIISFAELSTTAGATLVAENVGGIAGENKNNENRVTFVNAIIRGDLGSAAAGEKGIVLTRFVGAFFASSMDNNGNVGNATGGTEQVVVTLYGTLKGENKALALARGNIDTKNSWLQATNASSLPLSIAEGSGNKFNSIRVLNDVLLDVMIGADSRIKFTSLIKSSTLDKWADWYEDISGWVITDNGRSGFLEQDLNEDNSSYVTPKTAPSGVTYYVCYDTLEITSSAELFNLSILINNHDYYRNVRFALAAGIYVENGESLTPIGTATHPFNAIFDGDDNSIVFENGAILSGTEYAGLFGYTAENSIIRDFILDIRTGAKVGGVNSKTIGALVGENHGEIEDVYVNLSTEIVANSTATIGTFVGRFVADPSYKVKNCWVASANSIHKAVGNLNADASNLYYGINSLDILGGGALNVGYTGNDKRIFTVPTSVDVDLFAGFYSDIGHAVIISGDEYGVIKQPEGENKEISIIPSKSKKNAVVTISFFKTTIRNAKDFVDFANNVNLYGDRGASFELVTDGPITVDFNECPSIGTKERPFTGTFEGNGNTVCVTGSLIKRDYAGVFGYIGVGGSVNDLKIEVTGEDVVFGDRSTLYAGVAAAYLRGTLSNVAVVLRADTVVHTTQGTAACGGLVGRAEEGYSLVNAWLVLAEGSSVTNAVGDAAYYQANSGTRGVGRIMQQVGEGVLRTTVKKGVSIEFLDEAGSFYGFIDNDNNTEDKVTPIHDDLREDLWTVSISNTTAGTHMLAIFIQANIGSYEDLQRLSSDVRMGRNFRGITYTLTKDIVLGTDFIPIGGEFASSSVTDSYDLCTFIGGFDGDGHKITLPATMNNGDASGLRYAGLFGRVGKEARIYDLLVVAPENCAIGYDTGDNTTRTLYAGVLAGYYDMVSGGVGSKQGYFKDVVVVLEKGSTLYGATSVGRTFGYIPREAGTVTENCWAVSYNSRANYDMNAAEMTYWNSVYKDVGTNQGGVHNIMVIAAGKVTVNRANDRFCFIVDENYHWYTLNSIAVKDAVVLPEKYFMDRSFNPDKDGEFGFGYNLSYLEEEIDSLSDLLSYATNINKGYDFYKLTFKLTTDIEIDHVENGKDFISIGTAANGLNGTFDGCGHTITLLPRAKVEGAGIFGYIGEDGFLKNVKIVLQGTVESSVYAGAIGYNYGTMENVLVVSDGATLASSVGRGFVIGYDATNLLTNVWGLVDASEYLPEVGYSPATKPSVNTMKVIGIGKVEASFNDAAHDDYRVIFRERAASESYIVVGISGWYKSYEERQQISSAMLSGGALTDLYMVAPLNSDAAHYEVAVIQTKIKNQDDLVALAKDVNVGGYTFKNVEFTLTKDFSIATNSTLYPGIGDAEHPFKGIFNGNHHTITISNTVKTGVFGNNMGEIKDLTVVINATMGDGSDPNRIYGGIANLNGGSITHSKAIVTENGKISGYTVGGIVGRNDGSIEDCIVLVNGVIRATGGSGRNLYAGAVLGVNYGTVDGTSDFSDWENEDKNVIINGTVEAVSTGVGETVNAGGIVGYNNSGSIERMIVELIGTVRANAPSGESSDNVRAGGIVGHSRASIDNNVIILRGKVQGGLVGGTAGYLDGVQVRNTWQVSYTDSPDAAGRGARYVNRLCVKGNGEIAVAIGFDSNSILFTDVTQGGSDIDGWYESGMVIGSDSKVGNVSGGTFRPNNNVTNKYVEVVFVNTKIKTAKDLVDMASSVSGGLSGTNIVFTLEFDEDELTIEESDSLVAIGTERRPFNNVFDGSGKTLIFNALGGTDYVGLFGYIGTQGIVRNVTLVLNEGTYGSVNALYTALLAAYNDGRIENVTLVVNEGATLIGENVGALAGASYGKVDTVTLTMNGTVSASGSKDAYAAALIAKNGERLTNVTITSTGSITAVGQSYSYAGIIAAKTTSTIATATVTTSSTVLAGAGNAYAGLGVGINLGKLEKVYIDVTGGGFGNNGTNGGIVGNNANELSGVFIKLPAGGLGARNDSAVGSIGGAGEAIRNVWVYCSEISSMSKIPAVNCIAADTGMALSCPTAEEVLAGTIVYKGNVTSFTDRFALFAAVTNGTADAGTGAVTDGTSYETTAEVNYLTFTSGSTVAGVKMLFTARTTVGSGTELAAFAAAVNSGKYTFSGTFTLSSNITLPSGAFCAVGTAEHPMNANVVFDGQDHLIDVGDATIPNGVFGVSYGIVRNVGLRLTTSGDGTLVNEDHKEVSNVVLYVEKDAVVTASKVLVADEQGTTSNAWVITRNDGTAHASYPVIKVNGAGNVTMREGALFAECVGTDTIFIGYADAEKVLTDDPTFDTAEKTGSYTAEFISTVISDENALIVLDGVMKLKYTGENQTFTLGDNVALTATLEGLNANAFLGTIDGAGKTLSVNNVVSGSLFGKMQGILRNIRIDISAAKADLALFTSDATPTLSKVVIVEDRDDWALGTEGIAQASEYIYFETANETFYARFSAAPYNAYSVIWNNGRARIAYTFGDTVVATQQAHASQVFAGWKHNGAIDRESSITLETKAGAMYILNFINRSLAGAEDLTRLAEAVQGGFTYAGETFTVDGGFNVNVSVPTIGSAEHPFEGNIRGTTSMSKITFTGDTSVFIYELNGTMENVIFVFKGEVTGAEDVKPSLVYHNKGTMSAVVVVAGDAFADGAALTCLNDGAMSNCWFATSAENAMLSEGSRVGANRIVADEDELFSLGVQIAVTNVGVKIRFAFRVASESYLALYDEQGKVAFFDNYSYDDHSYIAPANTSGVYLRARSLNTVSNEDELKYLRQFLLKQHLASGSVIRLANDLTVTSAVSMPLGYKVNTDPYTFTFDLGYHTLTVASTAKGALFTSEDGMCGTIRNGTVALTGKTYALAAENTALTNVALHLPVAGIVLPTYTATDCAIITPYKDYYKAAYACYYYTEGAETVITVTADGITAVGADNDKYYYAVNLDYATINALPEKTLYGLVRDYHDNETEIIYAPAVIASADDFKRFALANENSVSHFEGKSFSFGGDVTIDAVSRPIKDFKGDLDAGYTLTVTSGTYNEAVFATAEGGSVRNFALAFGKTCVLGDTDMITGAAENSVVVSYRDLTTLHHETSVIALNIDQNGFVAVSFENGITFTGADVGNYALYSWKKVVEEEQTVVNKDEKGFALSSLVVADFAEIKTFIANFDERYAFLLHFKDKAGFDTINASVLAENANYLPTFKLIGAENVDAIDFVDGQAICFKSDFAASMKIEVASIGTGFMFWGLEEGGVTSKESALSYSVSAPTSGDLKATINVLVTYIKMDWKKMKYNAGLQPVEKTALISAIETAADAAGVECSYTYDNLGDTPPCVSKEPYHVGKYRVNFVVKDKTSKAVVCNAYAGLEITPVELKFVSVRIADKVYDGTADAQLIDVELTGYLTVDDKNAVSSEGLSFRFVDANAGVGKQVKVSGNGALCSSETVLNDNRYKYTYLDYTFDFENAIKSSAEGLVVATVLKKDLTLKIDSIVVDYLDQFGKTATKFLPANTSTVEAAVEAGLIAADYDLYTSVVAGLLTREDEDNYAVDAYRIIVNKLGAFDRLSNYNVTVLGQNNSDPYYIVTPSEIEVELSEVSARYGATPSLGGYVVKYKGAEVDISALQVLDEHGNVIKTVSDKLVFEKVVFGAGAELIPSDTKYGVRCLFSAKNDNYTLKTEDEEYETLNGDPLVVLTQDEVLKVDPKEIKVISDDSSNTKPFGKRRETLYASLVNGSSFVSSTHELVVSRERKESGSSEVVGTYNLIYSVVDKKDPANPVDISDRYEIVKVMNDKSSHVYTIKKVAVKIRIAETTLMYGESIGDNLKYSVVIGDGSLTVKDLYYALNGTEKRDATLDEIGVIISFDRTVVLDVGKNHSVSEVGFSIRNDQTANLEEEITIIGGEKCIEVQKRYLTIILNNEESKERKYNGTYDIPDFDFTVGVEKKDSAGNTYVLNGLVEKDTDLVDVVMTRAFVVGKNGDPRGLTVGAYKVDAEFAIYDKGTKRISELAENYEIRVQQFTLEVKKADVRIEATLGYFDENGSFSEAKLVHILADGSEEEKSGQIFYGDTRAVLRFTIPERYAKSYPFLKIPDGTDKEKSDYLVSELKINYNQLYKVTPGIYDASSVELSLAAVDNNYNVNFSEGDVNIARVNIKVTLLPVTKTIGDSDPAIEYVLTAYDDDSGAEIGRYSSTSGSEAEGYFAYALDVYSVSITATRTEGESLGTYNYENIVVEVANAYSGDVLTDNVETDDEQAVLIIEQESFLKTTIGKILAYGGPVLVVFAGALFLVLYVTVLRKKWKNKPKKSKKQKDEELFSDDEENADGEENEASEEGESAEEADTADQPADEQPVDETAEEEEAPTDDANAENGEGSEDDGDDDDGQGGLEISDTPIK